MKKTITFASALIIGLGCIASLQGCKPERFSQERITKAYEVQKRIEEADDKAGQEALIKAQEEEAAKAKAEAEAAGASTETSTEAPAAAAGDYGEPVVYDGPKGPKHATLTAPDVYYAKFECSNGVFVLECRREWAPIGADRFYNAVLQGFYDDVRFFRVVQGFVVQFGISGSPGIAAQWNQAFINDEPVQKKNRQGTITFAKSSRPNSRTTQVFINLKDNFNLDGMGFAPFGKVVEGMDVVLSLYGGYGDQPTGQQDSIQRGGNAFLKQAFPKLDYVKKATIFKK